MWLMDVTSSDVTPSDVTPSDVISLTFHLRTVKPSGRYTFRDFTFGMFHLWQLHLWTFHLRTFSETVEGVILQSCNVPKV